MNHKETSGNLEQHPATWQCLEAAIEADLGAWIMASSVPQPDDDSLSVSSCQREDTSFGPCAISATAAFGRSGATTV